MNEFKFYVFLQVPLDEGGYVLHYVGRYKTVVGMIKRLNRFTALSPWLYLPGPDQWRNANKPDHAYPHAPFPVLGAGVPKEIRHLVS